MRQRAAPGAIERVRVDARRWSRGSARSAMNAGATSRVSTRQRSPGSPAAASSRRCGAVPRGRDHERGVIDGSLAERTRVEADDRVLLRAARRARRAAPRDHAERRPSDPAREGRAVRGVPTADGRVRRRDRRPHPSRRRVRRSHRPGARDGARSRARLRPRPRHERRQRRRHRRPDRPAEPRGSRRDRGVVRRVEKLETAVEPRFQEHFVGRWASPTPAIRSRAWARSWPASPARRVGGALRATPARATQREQHMSDETATPRRRRSGGREARTAARLHAVAEGAVHHPHARPSRC